MHRQLIRVRRRRADERGAVAIIMAASLTTLMIVAGLVLDFGLIRLDRQVDKSAADQAVLAGLQGLMIDGGSEAQPFSGVCTAVRFLKANNPRFAAINENDAARWKDGLGAAKSANGCDATLKRATCVPGDASTWARFDWNGTWQGQALSIRIQSGYSLAATGWAEDSLAVSTTDVNDTVQGCDQLAVVVTQSRKPGLGSLAQQSDLTTSIRSVGRSALGPNGYAPAMLLLKRTGCTPNPLVVGGSGSFIHVLGSAANGVSQPGTIHTDDDGAGGCAPSGGKQVFNGATGDGIVAYAAPSLANPAVPDPAKPGEISSFAGYQGVAAGTLRDSLADVHGATGLTDTSPGTSVETTGRPLVTRQPVDSRYLGTVKTVVANSKPIFALSFSNATSAHTANWGYAKCASSGSIASVEAYSASRLGLYVDCNEVTSVPGSTISGWKTIVFSGSVKSSGSTSFKLPDATKVYIGGSSSDATTISGSGSSFQMHTTGLTEPAALFPDGLRCKSTVASESALLVVKSGNLSNGALFRACNTTVVMLGGDVTTTTNGGCLPTYDPAVVSLGPAPTTGPCSGGAGNGRLIMNGDVDWTAPNKCTAISDTLCDGLARVPGDGWSDVGGPEDLALWTESAAYGSLTARIGGSAQFNLRGVFMTPNFDPLVIGGGPSTRLTNAQFVSSSLNLNGGAQLTMSVDPDSAVKLKRLQSIGLVR